MEVVRLGAPPFWSTNAFKNPRVLERRLGTRIVARFHRRLVEGLVATHNLATANRKALATEMRFAASNGRRVKCKRQTEQDMTPVLRDSVDPSA